MSEFAPEAPVTDDPSSVEPTPWSPDPQEWEFIRDGVASLASEQAARQEYAQQLDAQQQQTELAEQIGELLDPFSENYDPARVEEMFRDAGREAALAELGPAVAELQAHRDEVMTAQGELEALEIIESFGIPEAEAEAVLEAASSEFGTRSALAAIEHFGVDRQALEMAVNSPDPQWRAWAEAVGEWALQAGGELWRDNADAAEAVIHRVAQEHLAESTKEAWYRNGGSAADRVLGGQTAAQQREAGSTRLRDQAGRFVAQRGPARTYRDYQRELEDRHGKPGS
jgi:hypothetical protein